MRKIDLEIVRYLVRVPPGTKAFEVLSKRPYERTKEDIRIIQRAADCLMASFDEMGKWVVVIHNNDLREEDVDNEGIGLAFVRHEITEEEFAEYMNGGE